VGQRSERGRMHGREERLTTAPRQHSLARRLVQWRWASLDSCLEVANGDHTCTFWGVVGFVASLVDTGGALSEDC
jgi:hypothetical protein